jgi:cell division protease FtsH
MSPIPPNKPPAPRATRRPGFGFVLLLGALWLAILARDFMNFRANVETIPYSQFLSLLDHKQVTEADVSETSVHGTLKSPLHGNVTEFMTLRLADPKLPDRLEAAGVSKFAAVPESGFLRDLLSWVVPAAVMVGLWWLLLSRMGGQARTDFFSLGKSKARVYVEKDLATRFSDVAGVDEAKTELKEVVDFLKNPSAYSRLGGRMPKGILLVGPPGTGKTLLARAVAGEAGVPFFSINGSEFVELFVGMGAARVRDLFTQARAQAPCIVFIDELDALGRARGLNAITGGSNDEKEQTLNQLLAELDGFDPSSGFVLLAATNRPEVLDPALLRAGRFDRQVLVDKPDRGGRRQILAVHLKNVRVSEAVNLDVLASLTAGFSGADLARLANEAALIATRRKAAQVEPNDFTEAIERLVAGLERKTRLLGPEEKQRVAYHEMGHATVALALDKGEAVHKVTIIPRGLGALGYTFRRPTEDRYLMNRRELEVKLAMILGGRAAEAQFFPDISTGAADDLDKATEIARAMITRYGMSPTLGPVTFEKETQAFLGGNQVLRDKQYSEATAHEIDEEVRRLVEGALHTATECLKGSEAFVHEAARRLVEQETLGEAELKALWEARGKKEALKVV